MRLLANFLVILLFVTTSSAVDINIVPTTTLAQETGNNTSAADSFKAQTNGNAGAGNVSKLPIRSLLYEGSTTKMYVHLMPWFGPSNHMNVGYKSDDPLQVKRQVADMMSRGINGAIVDWYGPGRIPHDAATLLLMREAEANPGFEFAICEDAGSIKSCYNTAGCDVSKKVIDDLNYVADTYFVSPAYIRHGGRPVVHFFGMDAYKDKLDWDRIRANVRGNPLFIFRNSVAYTQQQTNGGFSWLAPQSKSTATDGYMSLGYLDNFYKKALTYPSMLTFGSGFKGFDDSLAAWGQNRYIGQYCGQTWMQSMARAGLYYAAGNQLPMLQLVTWNDYEEGSSLESGIDNCLSVSASLSGTQLQWGLNGAGSESTIDHYRVYISLDGQNLMKLTDVASGVYALDLASFSLGAASYTLHVQAYGKPSFHNKMSNAVSYTVASTAPTVTILTPSDQETVGTSARIRATANSSAAINAMKIYVDGVSSYEVLKTANLDTMLPLAPGTRRVTVQAWDAAGAVFKSTIYVQVVAPTVTITSPSPGTTADSPVRVTATASSPNPVTAMKIYVDYAAAYEVRDTASLDAFLTLAPGAHRVTVQAWDATGAVFNSTVHIEVNPHVTIHAPFDQSSVSSPAHVSATAESASAVSLMRVYVDNKQVYQSAGAGLEADIRMSAGSHRLTVQAEDAAGATFSRTITITVKKAGCGGSNLLIYGGKSGC